LDSPDVLDEPREDVRVEQQLVARFVIHLPADDA
jgi:hypothetical protein